MITGQPRHLHPGTIIVSLIKQAPRQFVGIAAAIAALSKAGLAKGLIYAALLVLVIIGLRALSWWRFRYTVLPDELLIESGILNRNRRSIPWDRVQDVDIERDLFARIFGWAKVKLETGGAGNDEGALDSISIKDADALRDLVRSRRAGAVGSSETPPAAALPLVFTMPARRLVQAGFLNFSLVWMALIYAAYQSVKDWLPVKGRDVEQWLGDHSGALASTRMVALAIILFVVLGMISGIVQMAVTNFDFRLSVDGTSLRRARGLVTRSEIVIPRRRIQLAMVTRRWLARLFGFAHVAVQTMGTGHGHRGGTQDLAPLANHAETAQMLALAGDFVEPATADLQRVAPAHAWIESVTNMILVAGIVLLLAWFTRLALWGLWLVPVVGALSYLTQRPHAWHGSAGILVVRRGWFVQRQVLLPVRNIHSIRIVRGPLQRLAGLTTVAFDTAGGTPFGVRIANLTEDTARQLVARLRA